MKKNPYLLLLGFSVAWTIGQAAFRTVYNARQNEVMELAAEPAREAAPVEPVQKRRVFQRLFNREQRTTTSDATDLSIAVTPSERIKARRLGYTRAWCLVGRDSMKKLIARKLLIVLGLAVLWVAAQVAFRSKR